MTPENPPAFPLHTPYNTDKGMSLRDFMAAHAMQATLTQEWGNFDAETVAQAAYQIADAMLKERAK